MRCPECIKLGMVSRVYSDGCSMTLMAILEWALL
jgi:hypothetical protein